jgi:hypothetical protein
MECAAMWRRTNHPRNTTMKTFAWALLAGAVLTGSLGTAWAADDMKPAAAMDGKAMMSDHKMDGQMATAKRKKMAHGGKTIKKSAMKPAMKSGQKM